jgi:sortase A
MTASVRSTDVSGRTDRVRTGATRASVSLSRMRRFIGAVGRVLVTGGLLILLFVAYQLWGTGLLQARYQDDLRAQFEETLEESAPASTGPTSPATATPSTTTTPTAPPPVEVPSAGDAVATLDIPRLGLSQVVIEGVNVDDLRSGPGHYPATPLPGQAGNAAIAGHRTTYGAPFGELDQLAVGDEIHLRTVQGDFTYAVSTLPFVVSPDDGSVLDPQPDAGRPGENVATLTLTTCNPKYSAAERLIVQASLVLPQGAVPLAPTVAEDAPLEISGLDGEQSSRAPAILWGAIAALVGLAWWLLFRRFPRWYVWALGAIPFLVVLFVFFTYLERLLPTSY